MDSGFYSAVNGARRATLRLEVLSNNLSNVNTAGYKQESPSFDSYLTSPGPELFPLPNDSFMGLRTPGDIPFPYSNPSANAYRMTYPMAVDTQADLTQGPMQVTNNPLDVAIEGEGFFVIDTPQGRRYTRDGSFTVNTVGELVTKDGFQVLGEGDAAILVGNQPLSVGPDGTLSNKDGQLGRLQRVAIPMEALQKAGRNLYEAPQNAVNPVEEGTGGFHQGYVEGSNVDMIRGMTQMIEVNRQFENQLKLIQAMDGLDNKAANDLGRVA
ncbi:MAG: flagellar basal-body rod protein FlgF [Magnetococcales bacterium]|nr:flagellar basal-body rod protein FlgF [Magnetococcales bacterium]NGZ25280.1 flagellar basal-body rod protein FlgF [Magnetococcales bacterium]